MTRIAVVIVNYRTPTLVLDCLDSLEGELNPQRDQILVVDNGSGDDSEDRIREGAQSFINPIQIIRSERNLGFAGANNLALQLVEARYYLLLNSDTLVRPGAVRSLISAASKFPDTGLIGPRLEWPDGTPQVSCFRFRNPVGELIDAASTGPVADLLRAFDTPLGVHTEPIYSDWVSFAAVLIRGAAIATVGRLDADFFMYFEDIDYCRHARELGVKTLHWPDARVVHLRGGSSPVKRNQQKRKRLPGYYYASRARYLTKYYGRIGLWTANLLWVIGRSISMVREMFGRAPHLPQGSARDIWSGGWNPLRTREVRVPER